jgi:hypothetical protein
VPHGTDVDLVWAGYLKHLAPRRFFKFGLIDAVNRPYATFRFYYRSWEEIDKLGLHMGQVKSEGGSLFDQTVDEPEPVGPPGGYPMQHLGQNYSFLDQDPTASENRHSISGDYFANYPTGDQGPVALNQHVLNGPLSQLCFQPYHPTATPSDSNNCSEVNSAAVTNQYEAHTSSPSFHPEATSNFTDPFKRRSIPPALLFQPLLSKGSLPTSPAKLATEQRGEASMENLPPCPPPALTSVELSLEDSLQDISPTPGNTPWVAPRETPPARSPCKLVKRRSQERGVQGGNFIDRVLRRRSHEGPLDVQT